MTAAAVLDGFTVSGGNAINSSGGGMYNSGSSPTLTNCSFRNNFASQAGGGMYNNASNPTLTNCSFQSNSNLYGGAGLANNNSSPTLTNCSFQSNSSLDFNGLGGGMSNTSSNPTLTNCTFKGNYAYGGGGMSNDGSSPTLTNCSFQENYTENSGGGGMYNKDYSNPVLTNCTFRGNIANNYYGGAMLNVSSSPSMTNCILFDNGGNNTITFFFYSRFTVSNCLYEPSVTGIIPLEGNIVTSVNPFVSGTSIMLRPCSLAIDAGNDAANTTVTDLAGNPRKVRVIDMGAYEFQGNLPLAAEISANPTNNLGFRVTINGGTGPYKVVYSDGTNNYTIDGYQSGDNIPVPADQSITYTLGAVTDVNGCKASTSGSATVQEERCGPGNKNFKICYYGIEQCVSEKIAKRYLKLGATMGSCGGSSSARLGVEENTKLPLQLSLKAFPNPVQDLMTLEVLAPKAGPATFEVLDLTGRVRQTHHENLTEGLNEVIFRLGSLNAGIYLIRIVDAVKSQAVVRVSKQ